MRAIAGYGLLTEKDLEKSRFLNDRRRLRQVQIFYSKDHMFCRFVINQRIHLSASLLKREDICLNEI